MERKEIKMKTFKDKVEGIIIIIVWLYLVAAGCGLLPDWLNVFELNPSLW